MTQIFIIYLIILFIKTSIRPILIMASMQARRLEAFVHKIILEKKGEKMLIFDYFRAFLVF